MSFGETGEPCRATDLLRAKIQSPPQARCLCRYCGEADGSHSPFCPLSPEEVELWYAGFAAGRAKNDNFSDSDVFCLGWIMGVVSRNYELEQEELT